MRPYFPTEVEGKGVSSKLMVMVGVYMCYKVLICRMQVIKQTYVTCLFQNDPKNPIFVPYFLLEKSHISHIVFKMLSGQPAIKKSMLHAIIRYMQKKIEAPSPKIQYSIMFLHTNPPSIFSLDPRLNTVVFWTLPAPVYVEPPSQYKSLLSPLSLSLSLSLSLLNLSSV